MSNQGSNVSSGQKLRLWSDCVAVQIESSLSALVSYAEYGHYQLKYKS